jgi:hypothetical protein
MDDVIDFTNRILAACIIGHGDRDKPINAAETKYKFSHIFTRHVNVSDTIYAPFHEGA